MICQNKSFLLDWNVYRPNIDSSKRRSIEDIPSIELEIVLQEVVRQNLSVPEDGLTLIAAKRMGFARRGANVDAALNEVLSKLIDKGKLFSSDGKVTAQQ